MVKITYIEFHGARHDVDATPGVSVMEAARQHAVPGIDADCGGACACATCHVYVDPAWAALTGSCSDTEEAMLEAARDVERNSRLSCQMRIIAAWDGLIVHTPKSQQ